MKSTKKNTTKAAERAEKAPSPRKTTAAKAPAKKAAPVKKAATSKAAPKKKLPKEAAPKKAAPKKSAAAPATPSKRPAAIQRAPSTEVARSPSRPLTSIWVEADVGFGNLIFIRGEGPGLSWDRGVPMECRGADKWHWSSDSVRSPFVFKVLINDQLWSHGENFEIHPGQDQVLHPDF